MFTGIVRETGEIVEQRTSEDGVTFRFKCGSLHAALGLGHSISVDGVCLTVTQKGEDWVEVDATPETLRRSNLGKREVGEQLNLEPSLQVSDFLGGHLVQGHVDATGEVLSIRPEGNSVIFRVGAPEVVRKYCVFKGSVTLNGISLTISELGADYFEVAIIPHTLEVTNMSDLAVGDVVNLEADVISKYVESHVQRHLGGDSHSRGGPGRIETD
jgi:riboflavin synthase